MSCVHDAMLVTLIPTLVMALYLIDGNPHAISKPLTVRLIANHCSLTKRTLRFQGPPTGGKEKFNATIRNVVDVEAGDNLCSFLELMGYRYTISALQQ